VPAVVFAEAVVAGAAVVKLLAVLLSIQVPGRDIVTNDVMKLGPSPALKEPSVAAAVANAPASIASTSLSATSQGNEGLKVMAAE